MKILVAIFFFLNVVYSQNTCYQVLFEGYNISSVSDDHQFIWVGTFNSGLFAYDKDNDEIYHYNTSNSEISSDAILSVLKSNNRLYVSTESSLMVFSNETFEEISTSIQGIMTVAPNGNLAVAAPYEFNILDLDNEITYHKDLLTLIPQSCCGKTTDMDYDSTGKLWLSNYGFYEYDIITYGEGTWNVYDVNNSILPIESFYDYNGLTVHDGVVLVTNNGTTVHKYENNSWSVEHSSELPSIYNEQDNIEGLLINAIEFDTVGDLWIGAGNYENMGSGKMAYRYQEEWHFISDDLPQELPGVNLFKESQYEDEIMFAATNDGLMVIDKSCLRTLSLNDLELSKTGLAVYPNPTEAMIGFIINEQIVESYRIINSLGQVVYAEDQIKDNQIDLSIFPSGVYHVFFYLEQSEVVIKKIVKF